MDWIAVVGFIFKFLGQVFDMKAKNELTQEKLDMAIRMLEVVQPPKEK